MIVLFLLATIWLSMLWKTPDSVSSNKDVPALMTRSQRIQRRRTMAVSALFAALCLWVDLVLIVILRRSAQKAFGASYEDNAVGYGQIIVSGFAVQALAKFLGSISRT